MHTCDIEPGQAEEPMRFRKPTAGKSRPDLIPAHAWEAVAYVMAYGAEKYGPDNWKHCDDPAVYDAAAERHIIARRKGEIVDPDTGQPHDAHAIADLLIAMEIRRIAGE